MRNETTDAVMPCMSTCWRRPYRLFAGIGAAVLSQVGEPPSGLVSHQVGDCGEMAAIRAVQLPREPCRLVVAPEFGNELTRISFLPRASLSLSLAAMMLPNVFMTASTPSM